VPIVKLLHEAARVGSSPYRGLLAGARAAYAAVASWCTVAIREPEVEMTATETNWEQGAGRCDPISWSN